MAREEQETEGGAVGPCQKGIRDLTWGGGTAPLRAWVFTPGWSNDAMKVQHTPAVSAFTIP